MLAGTHPTDHDRLMSTAPLAKVDRLRCAGRIPLGSESAVIKARDPLARLSF